MQSPISSILNSVNRDPQKPLKILTSFTHESYESGLCKTGHQFYSFFTKGLKRWNNSRPLPQNYHRLPDDTIPDIDFDLVFSQTKFGQFQVLKPIANRLHLPIVCVEHTDVMKPVWSDNDILDMKKMKGDINIFITKYSKKRWMWDEDEAEVIRHGINTELFHPGNSERTPIILSVVNDWANRNYICGFDTWKRVTKDLPVYPVGDTKGFSEPSKSIEELVTFYQKSRVFINTSLLSPIPTSLLEAMACGCAVVSTNNCAIPEAIQHGVNGFLSNDEKELRGYCELLLKDEQLAKELGENARKTVLGKYSEQKFIQSWDEVFKKASSLVFKG